MVSPWTGLSIHGPGCLSVDRVVYPWTGWSIHGRGCLSVGRVVYPWTGLSIHGPCCLPLDRVIYPWTVWFIRGPGGLSLDRVVYPWTMWSVLGPCGLSVDHVVYPWTVLSILGPCGLFVDCVVYLWSRLSIRGPFICSACSTLRLLILHSHCFSLPPPHPLGDPGFFSSTLLTCHGWWLGIVPSPLGCSSSTFQRLELLGCSSFDPCWRVGRRGVVYFCGLTGFFRHAIAGLFQRPVSISGRPRMLFCLFFWLGLELWARRKHC